jgi:hypothetical protein
MAGLEFQKSIAGSVALTMRPEPITAVSIGPAALCGKPN